MEDKKKNKKISRSSLIKRLDKVFSLYIRIKNSNDFGITKCVTCNKEDHYKNMQCGHFISRKHYILRWDEENCNVQCVACNVFRYGEQYKYSLFLGTKLSKKLYNKSKKLINFTTSELKDKLNYYNKKIKEIQ